MRRRFSHVVWHLFRQLSSCWTALIDPTPWLA
jgi:hypothetical protein